MFAIGIYLGATRMFLCNFFTSPSIILSLSSSFSCFNLFLRLIFSFGRQIKLASVTCRKQCDWINGSIYAMKLKEECNWSPASNMYQYACFLAMEADRLEKKTVEKNSDANHCNTNEPPKVNEETEENDQVTKLRKSVYEAMRSVLERHGQFDRHTSLDTFFSCLFLASVDSLRHLSLSLKR